MDNEKNKDFILRSQDDLDAFLELTEKHNNETLKGTISGMMLIENLIGSFRRKWLKMTFPIQEWQANRIGQLQGGVYAVAMDVAASTLARCFNGTDFSPTVDMAVKYYRPVMIGDRIIVKAKILELSKTFTHIYCEARSQNTGKLVATANTTFMSNSSGSGSNGEKKRAAEEKAGEITRKTMVFVKPTEKKKNKPVKKTSFAGGYIRNIINNSDKL